MKIFRAAEQTVGRICFIWTHFSTMDTRAVAWGSLGDLDKIVASMYCADRPILQVSCLWHDIPLCILTSDILSNAFPLEDEGKLLGFTIFTILMNLKGPHCQPRIPDPDHHRRNGFCIWTQLDVQVVPWSDAARCRLRSNHLDLPSWPLLCSMESLPAILGNHNHSIWAPYGHSVS